MIELIKKYEARCKEIEELCIKRYNCKFEDGELIFPFNGDDEDNCMANGYCEEYYTLKGVIKDLEGLIK